MARAGVIEVPMREAVRGLTLQIKVTGVPIARARMWLGAQLMRLAAWVIGCDVEIETGSKGPTNGFIEDRPEAERFGHRAPPPPSPATPPSRPTR